MTGLFIRIDPEDTEALRAAKRLYNEALDGLLKRARQKYSEVSSDDIEIDDTPAVCKVDEGTWVNAWVWVPDAES